MHRLTTPISVGKSKRQLTPGAKVITLGSCFSSVLSKQLRKNAYDVLHNPFGTLYTPQAITTPLLLSLHPDIHYSQEDLFGYKGVYHALSFSSRFHTNNAQNLLNYIEQTTTTLSEHLAQASHLVITLGTAWHYSMISDHTSVGNCHRLPHALFTREFTPVHEMVEHLRHAFDEVTQAYPQLTIVLTISPVRHMRDNPLDNSKSKAATLLAAQQVASEYEQVEYFPSYEIMMDELRDYRYYADDLVHPSPLAESIIFERFQKAYFSKEAEEFSKEYEAIVKAREHIVQKPSQAQKFGERLVQKVCNIEEKYPQVSLSEDKNYFASLVPKK